MTVLPIAQADPRAGYLAHKGEIDAAVAETLSGGGYILGPMVERFEAGFAAAMGCRHAVGVGSGTDALCVALRACSVLPGDLVITVSHTAVATVAAIELVGARPVLVDIDPSTYTLDPDRLERAVRTLTRRPAGRDSARLKAIVPVHLYGHPADMPAIMDIAARYGLLVIEDCAQAHGASIRETGAGNWGHAAAYSFYPTKNLGALGDGGAVTAGDDRLAERARLIRQYGWQKERISRMAGMNSRLDELQAAILTVKLNHLEGENARRRRIAGMYDNRLESLDGIRLPAVRPDARHVYHQYVIRAARRDELREHLRRDGVGTAVHYPVPVHRQPAYENRIMVEGGGLEQTERICGEILSLPMFPQMSDEQVARVGQSVSDWMSGAGARRPS